MAQGDWNLILASQAITLLYTQSDTRGVCFACYFLISDYACFCSSLFNEAPITKRIQYWKSGLKSEKKGVEE